VFKSTKKPYIRINIRELNRVLNTKYLYTRLIVYTTLKLVYSKEYMLSICGKHVVYHYIT